METNNGSTFNDNNGNLKVAVNSIQRTLFVERLKVDVHYPCDRIIPYDTDNLYPNKIKSIAERSSTTMGAIDNMGDFISGEGFDNMDLVVNRDGQSMWDILRHIAYSRSMFKGYALHFNYNLFGQISEITPINFEFVRWSKDLRTYTVTPFWGKRNYREEVIYTPFDISNVKSEIELAKGVQNYKGQLYYWIPNKHDWYTVCTFDSMLDDAQFEAEAKLYSLSSSQNDYSLSGIVAIPLPIQDKDMIDNLKSDLKGDTGAANAGGVRVIEAMPTEGLNGWKWFTPISRNNIDSLHKNQVERAIFNIYAGFKQPPILSGVSSAGMFNEASFADAFNYYNAMTESYRKDIEKELTKIMAQSVWSNFGEIQIVPKKYTTRDQQQTLTPEQNG